MHALFCTNHDHTRECLTPETTTHAVTTWRAAGPTGHRLHIHADDDVSLDADELGDLIAHLTTEHRHL